MRAFRVLILIAAAVALGSARAGAADAPPIRLSVPACSSAPFSVEAFVGSLEVELAGHLPACCLLDRAPPAPGDDPGGPQPGLRVTLSIDPCDESATAVDVRVHDPAHPAGLERRVGLGDIPIEARPTGARPGGCGAGALRDRLTTGGADRDRASATRRVFVRTRVIPAGCPDRASPGSSSLESSSSRPTRETT